jgi:signal transduction histidine kinase/AmiR/NasT family two-component response regulator
MNATAKRYIILFSENEQINQLLRQLVESIGMVFIPVRKLPDATRILETQMNSLVILDEKSIGLDWQTISIHLLRNFPTVPIEILLHDSKPETYQRMFELGIQGVITYPIQARKFIESIELAFYRIEKQKLWFSKEERHVTARLEERIDEFETLTNLGASITRLLDLNAVLTAIVEAAVKLTKAEEGNILLKDDRSDELYMVAAKNFKDEFVRTFRLPTNNSLAGQVIQSGKPMLIDSNTPQKIKTQYLVHSLIYVPLIVKEKAIGVLGVDNRLERAVTFKDREVKIMRFLAEYAAIAITNARLYLTALRERSKMEAILTNIRDGIIILDNRKNIVLANEVAQRVLTLPKAYYGKSLAEQVKNTELVQFIKQPPDQPQKYVEINDSEGNAYMVQFSRISEVGLGITLHDITSLKNLDELKSDFVNTVSHDLRSPLTAILGYAELIDRIGGINNAQHEFIQRIRGSVREITSLIDDLLNLSRIESSMEEDIQPVQLSEIINQSLAVFQPQIEQKKITIQVSINENLPDVLANPIHVRSLFDNLIGNAIKYTLENGRVTIQASSQNSQTVITITDTGIGIPEADQPRIFNKFYRGSNATEITQGTGLGLSIVQSVLDKLNGRVWVDSKIGMGSTFTVLLPQASAVKKKIRSLK